MTNLARVSYTFTTTLPAPAKEVFPLLCPVREYDWIPLWKCEMIYSKTGIAELGCVFRTQNIMEEFGEETWVVSHYSPDKRIAFVRIGAVRSTRYDIRLQDAGDQCEISWTQELTALTEEANQLVSSYLEETYHKLMIPLNRMLAHYLETGEMMKINEG